MILSHDNDTIIAQCTPQGSGALALLRLCGTHAIQTAAKFSKLASSIPLEAVASHTVHFGWVVDTNGSPIDQVMFIVMHGPKTFTGQDTVEITTHNNQFLIADIIQQAINHGARFAKEGEFARRAVLNNKIDVVQAEAINDLIHANTHYALKKSLAQLEGSFSHWITQMEKDLTKALALSEASFEFLDEEISFAPTIKDTIEHTIASIQTNKKSFSLQQQIRQGIRIALVGSVNAGKSSLFNALLNKERAIVTNIAGTTRDAIEAGLYKKDAYWTLIDTAGLRQTDDIIEQKGIERSHQEAHQADIILLVIDRSRAMTPAERVVYQEMLTQYEHKILLVYTKADIEAYNNEHLASKTSITVSSSARTNIDALEEELQQRIEALVHQADAPFMLNQRQFNLMLGLEKALFETMQLFAQETVAYELLSIHLKEALTHTSELTGKSISENAMDTIFREFCIGK